MMVSLLKGGGGGYWGIGLVEVVWKVSATVVNCWIKQSMTQNDTLQGFRVGRGTGTLTL